MTDLITRIEQADGPRRLFLAHRRDIWVDSWTYGNYRQWLCPRGGETQCARVLLWLPFGWRIMWAVGPLNRDGRRVFPWEGSAILRAERNEP